MARNRVIGKNNKLPWHYSEDLKHFKRLTLDQTLIMGRKTYESIGKALPNRDNFVLSRSQKMVGNRLYFFDSLEKALEKVQTKKVFIIGGADLFKQTINMVDGIYLTKIPEECDGDTFYPKIPDYFVKLLREKLQDSPRLDVIFYKDTRKKAEV